MARDRRLTIAALVVALVLGCGSGLPVPRTTNVRSPTDYIEVPYPPPAARVEIVPPRPTPTAVWVDGEWTFRGKRWVWEPGGWVDPPGDAYFAPWIATRRPDGKLSFAPGSWHGPKGEPIPKPPILAPAETALTGESEAPSDAGGALLPDAVGTQPPLYRGEPGFPGTRTEAPRDAGIGAGEAGSTP
jgi:hypothetical protein